MQNREWLHELAAGDSVLIDNGKMGTQRAKVAKITPQQIVVKFGKEMRRFCRKDGGTFQAPSASKSWLKPLDNSTGLPIISKPKTTEG